MAGYRPAPCAPRSRYRLAILHHTSLRLRWPDRDRVADLETLTPEDLDTRGGKEFLLARNTA